MLHPPSQSALVVFDTVALVNNHHLPLPSLQSILVPHCHLIGGNNDWETFDLVAITLDHLGFDQLLAQHLSLIGTTMIHDDWNLCFNILFSKM